MTVCSSVLVLVIFPFYLQSNIVHFTDVYGELNVTISSEEHIASTSVRVTKALRVAPAPQLKPNATLNLGNGSTDRDKAGKCKHGCQLKREHRSSIRKRRPFKFTFSPERVTERISKFSTTPGAGTCKHGCELYDKHRSSNKKRGDSLVFQFSSQRETDRIFKVSTMPDEKKCKKCNIIDSASSEIDTEKCLKKPGCVLNKFSLTEELENENKFNCTGHGCISDMVSLNSLQVTFITVTFKMSY